MPLPAGGRWHTMAWMRIAREQRGQTTVEWLAIAAVLVAVVLALSSFAPTIGGTVAGAVEQVVCRAGGGSCGGASSGTPVTVAAYRNGPTPTPAPTPSGPQPSSPTGAQAQPTPNPQPQQAPPQPGPWRWPASAGTHADQLPTDGDRPYSPPKSGRGNPVRQRGGGYVDEDGNVWEWAPPGAQHGGPHWDVQHPDGSHTNVAPDGTVIGKDNFPNRRRVPKQPKQPSGGDDKSGNTTKIVAGAGAAAGAGAIIWWLGKVASPACGPFAPVCAIVF